MITKVRNNPEDRIVASDFIKIGDSIRLNRERNELTIIGMSNTDIEQTTTKFSQYTDDGVITDSEKESLVRELDAITSDYGILMRNAQEFDLGDIRQVTDAQDAFSVLSSFIMKIVNTRGVYDNTDVTLLNTYYSDYIQKASVLSDYILLRQSEESTISAYYSRTKVIVNIVPNVVAVNTTAFVSSSVLYDGVEKITDINASALTFYVTGLSSVATTSDFTSTEAGFDIDIDSVRHTAEITGCKTFSVSYDAISDTGMTVNLELTLDSDSMPF